MDYCNMMKDCVSYINRHRKEELTADSLGRIHSLRGEYISYLFSCYYLDFLDQYIKKVKEESNIKSSPVMRQVRDEHVQVNQMVIDGFSLSAYAVVKDEEQVYRPIESAVKHYKRNGRPKQPGLTLWWHDEEYKSYYMQGYVCEKNADDGSAHIYIPGGRYVVFSLDEEHELSMEEAAKQLFLYVQNIWKSENAGSEDELGYSFHCFINDKVYYCLALKEEDEKEPLDKVYSVDSWVEYIDKKLTGNLTITSLAKKFNYSVTHFKRIFRMYYKMSVADYIRRRRLTIIAEEIRAGVDYMESSAVYGFKTYTGFARAFKKEFHVSPAVYSKGMFEVIDLKQYYAQYKDKLMLSVVEMPETYMIGQSIIPSKGEEVDIPAQVSYWIGKEIPCLKNTRYECNVAVRDDKIALWYQEEDSGDIEYILGPVVDCFEEDTPDEMIKVALPAGKYAIFETENMTDEGDVAEILRMYIRCVYYGWIKEHRERVDLNRWTFERYENGKIFLYVPVYY